MTEDQQFEDVVRGVMALNRPVILALLALGSAAIVGATIWRSVIFGLVIFVLMVAGLGRRTLEKLCLAGSLVALVWWMQIPVIVEAAGQIQAYLR